VSTRLISGRTFDVPVPVTNRKAIRYHLIMGMDILRQSGFPVGPARGNGPQNGLRAADSSEAVGQPKSD
jgi:hypothetical protein